MTILVNRRSGSQTDAHAYLIQFNIFTGNVEFSARGSGLYTNTLISRPYLERWYHIAIVRQSEVFTAYVDGRLAFSSSGSAGNAATTDGLSIGGWGNGKYLFGEVQEVSIYQNVPPEPQAFIVQNMFSGQPTNDLSLGLRGYFPLAGSTNIADGLRNFAPTPVPSGTDSASLQGAGTVTFEEANEAGEQSAFDARKNGGRDSLAPLSGGFAWKQTALARPTPGVAMDFSIGYSSANVSGTYSLNGFDPYALGPLGKGWRHAFETRVLPAQSFSPLGDKDTVGLMSWDGAVETWDKSQDTGFYLTRDREYRGEFIISTTNCQWTTPDRLIYVFRLPDSGSAVMRGRLTSIRDFNSNYVQILWNETSGVITQIVDSAVGKYSLNYQAGLLTNINFNQWQVNFAYDTTNRLISKTLTNTSGAYATVNTTWQFQYNTNGLLSSIIDPRTNANVIVQYDQYGRQTNQVDALNRSSATRYGVPGKRQITRVDPGTNSWVETYDRKGHILAQQDPLTNITSYTYDTKGNRITITEPLGWTTSFGYDERANVVAQTNALGEVTRWEFHPFFNKATNEINALGWTNSYAYDAGGNLTNHFDALGSLVRYTYSTNGLVLTSTDANGNTSQFAYDTNGFLIARTDPATNTWQFTVNDVGWKLAESNPLNDTTTFAYDLNGNMVQTIDPLNRTFVRHYDANGNLLAQSDGKNQFTRYAYDAANQRIATTNRVGSVWQFTFTSRGKPERATDPLGNTVTNSYDPANRLVRVSDPLGNTITNQYDANGNFFALFDVLGQRWTKTIDRLNRVIAEADPLGNSKTTTFDAAGRIKIITTPNGFPSQHDYDGRGRLTKWQDAEGFNWLYDYDGNSNITNITDALEGRYVMAYGTRNERTLERNQDNFEWQYTYDQLLRLKTQRDPNLTLRTRTYDLASRVRLLTLSTGREDSYDYDDNDNPRVIVRRVNGVAQSTTSLTYDSLDRTTRVVDPHGQSVDYGFDALSRVVSVTYPGNRTLTNRYDALSRLTNQVDWAARQMKYGYDKAGRLVRREYPNGVVQTNTFDSAGRLTGLSHSPSTLNSNSLNVALTYAYDRNGNKVGNTERGTFAWPMPTLTDEASQFTPAGRLMDRTVSQLSTNNSQLTATINYSYDSSGNMTNAAGGGQSWCLTYDEDNRTTSIKWDCGMTEKIITNRYDALGRRISRKMDNNETRFVLDLSGGMERILCDSTASGQITAYYIHGPDLCYRVDASNNVIYYHADAQANIIAVTDGGGTNVAQYAYTPYGRSLGSQLSTNNNQLAANSQPYTFVGSQGVMEESDIPGLYFMRARYYSADAGVFLSTDPVKKIGPGWKPMAYGYADGNPLRNIDPNGEVVVAVPFAAAFLLGVAYEVLDHELNNAAQLPEGVKTYENVDGTMMDIALLASPDPISKSFLAGKYVTKLLYMTDEFRVSRGASSNAKSSQLMENNPITRVSSGMSPQNIAQSFLQNPQVQQVKDAFTGATPLISAPSNGDNGGGSSGSSSLFGRTTPAISYGQSVTAQTKTPAAKNSNGSGTTTQSVSSGNNSSSSGNNAFNKVVSKVTQSQTYQSVSKAVQTITSKASTAAKSAWSTVKSWFK